MEMSARTAAADREQTKTSSNTLATEKNWNLMELLTRLNRCYFLEVANPFDPFMLTSMTLQINKQFTRLGDFLRLWGKQGLQLS